MSELDTNAARSSGSAAQRFRTAIYRAKWRIENRIDELGGERVLRTTHGASEFAKRATCAIFGHRMDQVQDMYDGEWESFCARCCDEGNFDGLKRIPNPLAWWLHDVRNHIMASVFPEADDAPDDAPGGEVAT